MQLMTGPRKRVAGAARPRRESRPTLIEELEASPKHAQELAAARFAMSVDAALVAALEQAGVSKADLADILGVSASAASQVFDSEGNLRVSTIARYARALGYQAALQMYPVAPGALPLHLETPANVVKRARPVPGSSLHFAVESSEHIWKVTKFAPQEPREVRNVADQHGAIPDQFIVLKGAGATMSSETADAAIGAGK
jgi:transcriptional regulator with XRE-family HTH domain